MLTIPRALAYGVSRNPLVRPPNLTFHGCGCLQIKKESTLSSKHTNKIRKYVFTKFYTFVQGYGAKLERNFPTAYRTYRVFMDGMQDFYCDMKTFLKVAKKVRQTANVSSLTRKEMELYYQMPKDMKKVAPLLVLSTLPLTNYLILPLIYFFPRQLLSHHFWNLQQRVEFATDIHRIRLGYYRPVFRALQEQVDGPDLTKNPLQEQWRLALERIGSGTHPKPDEILSCQPLFKGSPYSLQHLYSGHVKVLTRMHGMHVGLFWRRRKLAERALWIHGMDKAIIREGGPRSLSYEELRVACFIRGLNPVNMKTEDIVEWLTDWVAVSQKIENSSLSLLLHCPILLGYNQPSNWSLLKYH